MFQVTPPDLRLVLPKYQPGTHLVLARRAITSPPARGVKLRRGGRNPQRDLGKRRLEVDAVD